MIKDILKLVIAAWIVKHFVIDNDLLEGITKKLKETLTGLLK